MARNAEFGHERGDSARMRSVEREGFRLRSLPVMELPEEIVEILLGWLLVALETDDVVHGFLAHEIQKQCANSS